MWPTVGQLKDKYPAQKGDFVETGSSKLKIDLVDGACLNGILFEKVKVVLEGRWSLTEVVPSLALAVQQGLYSSLKQPAQLLQQVVLNHIP